MTAPLLALTLVLAADPGGIRFRDATLRWDVRFEHHNGARGDFLMPETMGSGVAVFDADGDGDLDLLFVGSAPAAGSDEPPTRLLRQDATAAGPRFVDQGARARVGTPLYGMGAVAGDLDADGDLDLVVTGYGGNRLLRNRGDGSFEDATAAAGIGSAIWSTSAALGDVDADGDLDLYLAEYVSTDLEHNPVCGLKEHGVRSYCRPEAFDPLPDRFFRNRGDGVFEDASGASGIAAAGGRGLGVAIADLDGDRRSDVYVADDLTPNLLFHNRGGFVFEEIGLVSNTALNAAGHAEAGMGIAVGDADLDGRPELFVTNFELETNALYGNLGEMLFVDRRYASRLGEPSLFFVGFGTAFADFDLDGDLDLAVANGHIAPGIERWSAESRYRQRNQVFENEGDGRFREAAAGLDVERSSRGLATGDLDGDLDLDLVVTSSNDLAEVWENVSPRRGRALGIDLAMPAGEAQGIGTLVTRVSPGPPLAQEVRAGDSYLSASASTALLGLPGDAAPELLLELRDGRRLRLRGLAAERRIRVDVPPPR